MVHHSIKGIAKSIAKKKTTTTTKKKKTARLEDAVRTTVETYGMTH